MRYQVEHFEEKFLIALCTCICSLSVLINDLIVTSWMGDYVVLSHTLHLGRRGALAVLLISDCLLLSSFK